MYYYSYSTNTNIIGCNLSISEFIKSIADQIQIVNYAIQNSIHMAADKYGIETKSIRNWKKQLLELQKIVANLSKVLFIMEEKQKLTK